jgi:PadR family transcriptional regulator, regulatory protein PadR
VADSAYLGEFELLVLLAVLRLSHDDAGAASGAAIARELEVEAQRRVSRGALYTTLDRLEGKGLLRWKVALGGLERNTLPRRAYAVTARGLDAVRSSQRTLQRMWQGLDRLLKERA